MKLQTLIDKAPNHMANAQFRNFINTLSSDEWVAISRDEPDVVWTCVQSFDLNNLYNNDGWYRVYKIILTYNPSYIKHIQPTIKFLHGLHGEFKTRLTTEQYDDLCQMGNINHEALFAETINHEALFAETIKKFREELVSN
jgi:hypothetical protein